jgi:hypothetical protein
MLSVADAVAEKGDWTLGRVFSISGNKNQPFRVVGRNPKATLGATETLAADLTDEDQTIRAVAAQAW